MFLKSKQYRTVAYRAFAVIAAASLPAASFAEEVVLKSADGTVNITGEYVDFVDDNYVIRTALGELRVSAARVSCVGAACPTFETAVADMKFAGADEVAVGMMPLVMSGFADSQDAEASTLATGSEGEFLTTVVGDGGFGDDLGTYLVSATEVGDAFKSLESGEVDFALSNRRITPTEARALKASGAGNMVSPTQEHILAVDSIVVITHPSNPVSKLTMEQIGDIFSGRITNWQEVGGTNAPISVVTRQGAAGEAFFESVFGQPNPPQVYGTLADSANTVAAMVNSEETAIGFVGYAFQRGAKSVAIENACGIVATPDAFTAKTEEYPLQRRIYAYNRGDTLSPEQQDFITYARSEGADAVIAKSGFIDLGVARQSMDMESPRAQQLLAGGVDAYESQFMREMVEAMQGYERLSTTFRFRTGSSRLDERARTDLERLISYIEEQPEGAKIRIVGFTDSDGSFDSNRTLSAQRAAQVAQDLVDFGGERLSGVTIDTAGFGEISPSACNTSDRGKAINRRVEVWIEAPSSAS